MGQGQGVESDRFDPLLRSLDLDGTKLSMEETRAIWDQFDQDGSGALEPKEIKKFIEKFCSDQGIESDEDVDLAVRKFLELYDVDKNGIVTWDEVTGKTETGDYEWEVSLPKNTLTQARIEFKIFKVPDKYTSYLYDTFTQGVAVKAGEKMWPRPIAALPAMLIFTNRTKTWLKKTLLLCGFRRHLSQLPVGMIEINFAHFIRWVMLVCTWDHKDIIEVCYNVFKSPGKRTMTKEQFQECMETLASISVDARTEGNILKVGKKMLRSEFPRDTSKINILTFKQLDEKTTTRKFFSSVETWQKAVQKAIAGIDEATFQTCRIAMRKNTTKIGAFREEKLTQKVPDNVDPSDDHIAFVQDKSIEEHFEKRILGAPKFGIYKMDYDLEDNLLTGLEIYNRSASSAVAMKEEMDSRFEKQHAKDSQDIQEKRRRLRERKQPLGSDANDRPDTAASDGSSRPGSSEGKDQKDGKETDGKEEKKLRRSKSKRLRRGASSRRLKRSSSAASNSSDGSTTTMIQKQSAKAKLWDAICLRSGKNLTPRSAEIAAQRRSQAVLDALERHPKVVEALGFNRKIVRSGHAGRELREDTTVVEHKRTESELNVPLHFERRWRQKMKLQPLEVDAPELTQAELKDELRRQRMELSSHGSTISFSEESAKAPDARDALAPIDDIWGGHPSRHARRNTDASVLHKSDDPTLQALRESMENDSLFGSRRVGTLVHEEVMNEYGELEKRSDIVFLQAQSKLDEEANIRPVVQDAITKPGIGPGKSNASRRKVVDDAVLEELGLLNERDRNELAKRRADVIESQNRRKSVHFPGEEYHTSVAEALSQTDPVANQLEDKHVLFEPTPYTLASLKLAFGRDRFFEEKMEEFVKEEARVKAEVRAVKKKLKQIERARKTNLKLMATGQWDQVESSGSDSERETDAIEREMNRLARMYQDNTLSPAPDFTYTIFNPAAVHSTIDNEEPEKIKMKRKMKREFDLDPFRKHNIAKYLVK